MELQELLDNPDYVNANDVTRRAIFQKYSKDNKDYVSANSETRQAIHQRFGVSNVVEPLPAKITDFDMRDVGNLVKQSMGQANEILAETSKKTGRTPVVGPAVMAGVGELIKGAGAVGELATDSAKPITEIGQTITQGAKQVNPVSGTVGQVGSYIAPYKMASSAIANTVGRVPYIRGAVNPATMLGSTGEMIGSGALVGGLTTPGDYEERMKEAQLQAMMGGGVNLALRGAPALYQGSKQIATGGREGLINKTWNENPNTAFSTMGDTVYPNTTVKPWQQLTQQQQVAGLPALEASKIPSASLFNTTGSKIAKTFAPKSPNPGEILVPYQGKTLQAFGENLGRDFANQPALTSAKQLAAPVIGGLLGGPLGLAAGLGITGATNLFKMAELASLAKLGKTAALQPKFAQELKAAQQAAKIQQSFTPPNQSVGKGFTAPGQNVPGPISPNTAINPAQMAQAQTQQAVNNMPRPAPVVQPPVQQTVTLQPKAQTATESSPITKAKEQVVGQDTNLQRYTKDYVVPEHLEQPIKDFTNGTQKNVLAMGDPGTGKSSLAGEWLAKNPDGRFDLVHTGTTATELRNIIKNTQLSDKNLILVDEVGKMTPKMQEMISKEVGKLPNVQVLYTSNLPDVAKVHKSISGNPGINMPLQMSAELTPAQKQAYGLSTAERFNVQNLTPEQIAEKSLQGKNFRDIKRSVTEGTKLQQEPLFEHQVMNIGLPEGVAKKIDTIVNNREGQRNIIIIDKAVFSKDPSLATSLNKLEGIGPIGENLTKDLITSKTTSPIHRIQILDKGDADKLSGLKGLIERSNETQYPTNIIVENRAGLKLDPALESRAVRITLDDLKQPVTKEQQLVEKFKNVPGYKPPSNVSKMMTPEDTFKALKQDVPRSDMGLTEGKIFDMTQAERNSYKKTLTAQLNSPKLYPMDKQLIENALKLIDKYDFK